MKASYFWIIVIASFAVSILITCFTIPFVPTGFWRDMSTEDRLVTCLMNGGITFLWILELVLICVCIHKAMDYSFNGNKK
jgi:hypothetical protein